MNGGGNNNQHPGITMVQNNREKAVNRVDTPEFCEQKWFCWSSATGDTAVNCNLCYKSRINFTCENQVIITQSQAILSRHPTDKNKLGSEKNIC